MKNIIFTALVAAVIAAETSAQQNAGTFDHHAHESGQGVDAARADGHAPIGVMGDHTHPEGGWMLSYRFMDMRMSGMRRGTDSLSNSEVLATGTGSYMIAPQNMDMSMHMFGAMYAWDDDLTLMVMVPYIEKDMDLRRITLGGVSTEDFNTKTSGVGDLSLTALKVMSRGDGEQVHLNLGLSLPTGSITEKDGILQMDGTTLVDLRLPYSMQIGTGTVNLRPGVTYLNQSSDFSWGAQAHAVLHIGRNAEDYSFGNRFDVSSWTGVRITERQSLSLRFKAGYAGGIDGADPAIAPLAMMNPLANPNNYGGTRAEVGFGWNLYADSSSSLAGQRLAVELLVPIYEDLNGPQMEIDWTVVVGWQYAF